MRIYIPATARDIACVTISARTVHAHTAHFEREADVSDVPAGERRDVLEAIVMNAAADDSLRLLIERANNQESIVPRRVVIVANVDDSALHPCTDPELLPTALCLASDVQWKHVESIHIDDDEALDDITAAAHGNDTDFERSYEHELMWYDVTERSDLIRAFQQ